MYCKKCGAYNSNNSLKCKSCGDYFVNQYNDVVELNDKTNEHYLYSDDNKDNNSKKTSKNHDQSVKKDNKKQKKVKTKIKKKRGNFFRHNKKINNNKKKDRNSKTNSYKEKEVIVKTSLLSKITILFLTFLVLLLCGVSLCLGLYILKDKVVKMPDVMGLSSSEAIKVLDDNGISYEIKEQEASSDNLDKIIDQNPDAGTYFFKNKTVEIIIGTNDKSNNTDDSSEEDVEEIVLEDYVGKNIDDAKKVLDDLGIKYKIEEISLETDSEDNVIVKQDPGKGSKVTKNTIVTLYIPTINKDEDIEIDNANT